MRPKMYNASVDSNDQDILFPRNLGQGNDFYMILQDSFGKYNDGWKEQNDNFHLAVHSPFFIPTLKESGHEIRPGTFTTITVTPQQFITSKEVSSMSESQRDCRFEFENDQLKLFKKYHQDGCIFECMLETVSKLTNCTPWNYPDLNESSQRTCNYTGKNQFDVLMKKPDLNLQCKDKCPADCTRTQYTTFVSSVPFDSEDMCKVENLDLANGKPYPKYPYFSLMRFDPLYGPINAYYHIVEGKDLSLMGHCKDVLKKIAVVRIHLASNTASRIVRMKRMSFPGYIANVGK